MENKLKDWINGNYPALVSVYLLFSSLSIIVFIFFQEQLNKYGLVGWFLIITVLGFILIASNFTSKVQESINNSNKFNLIIYSCGMLISRYLFKIVQIFTGYLFLLAFVYIVIFVTKGLRWLNYVTVIEKPMEIANINIVYFITGVCLIAFIYFIFRYIKLRSWKFQLYISVCVTVIVACIFIFTNSVIIIYTYGIIFTFLSGWLLKSNKSLNEYFEYRNKMEKIFDVTYLGTVLVNIITLYAIFNQQSNNRVELVVDSIFLTGIYILLIELSFNRFLMVDENQLKELKKEV